MLKKVVLIVPFIMFLLISCNKEVLKGEGPISTENRNYVVEPYYHTIKVYGNVKVYVQFSYEKSFMIKGYASLLDAFSTEIVNGILTLRFKENVKVKNDNIEVYIAFPRIGSVELYGNSEAYYTGNFPLDNEVNAIINGDGIISYQKAYTNYANFTINRSGKIDGKQMAALEANVTINGSGEANIEVLDSLTVNINGSGVVYYKGNPVVKTNISGSGKIIPLK